MLQCARVPFCVLELTWIVALTSSNEKPNLQIHVFIRRPSDIRYFATYKSCRKLWKPIPGNGLVAKENIKAGTLLLACQAYVFVDASEGIVSIDPTTMAPQSLKIAPLVEQSIRKLLNNSESADAFYKLHAGEKLGSLEKADQSNPSLSIVLWASSVATYSDGNGLNTNAGLRENPHRCGGGLWLPASSINHSCVDLYIFHFVVDDFVFVRTIRDVKAGEEQVTSRTEVLTQYGFVCACRLCQADRSDSQEVQTRFQEIRKTLMESRRSIRKWNWPKRMPLWPI